MEQVKQLEEAAQMLLAPPNVVTSEQRHKAEEVFLSFRKSHMPYELCRTILESCRNDYVLFQAASTIKEGVVREWPLLQSSDIEQLHSFLLHYVTKHPQLENYVREQILQAVAVIFKRASIETHTINKENLFSDVSQLITTGDITLQLIACSILTCLLNEFSSSAKSSNVGLTWEFHSKCKTRFEQEDLKRVFLFSLQVLQELEKCEPPYSREVTALWNRMLAITEQVVSWAFIPKNIPKRVIGTFLTNQSASFKPPPSWKDMVLNKEFIELFFRIHNKVRHNSEMAHHSLQCLGQLATINGTIFVNDEAKLEHLQNYVTAFMEFLNSCDLADYEALGVATMIHNLAVFHALSIFSRLPPTVLRAYIECCARLTCRFSRCAALEEAMIKDETLYQEAFEVILNSWLNMLTDPIGLPTSELKPHAMDIFNSYLQCHLSPPDGSRKQAQDGTVVAEDDEEYDEACEDDRVKFADQLAAIGAFARLVPKHAIALLGRLLEERVSRLHGQLKRLATVSPLPEHDSVLTSINEDLHWILLISNSVLTESAEGEMPLIPDSIMKLSLHSAAQTDIDSTLKVLSSPSRQLHELGGSEASADPVVRLVSAVFRLCEVEQRAIESRLTSLLSPQVASSTMYFLQNWVQAYLLPSEKYYTEFSQALVAAFGRDSDGGSWTVSYLVGKVVANLSAWSAEAQLIDDTLNLLIALVEKRERATFVVKTACFWQLAKDMSVSTPPLDCLAAFSQRLLCQALVLAGSVSLDSTTQEQYWKMVLSSFHDRFCAVLKHPDLQQRVHDTTVRQDVANLLESVIGVLEASSYNNADVLFSFLQPLLVECCAMLDVFHTYVNIVTLILEIFNTTAAKLIGFLSKAETNKIYECSLSVVQMYAKHNTGKVFSDRDSEEEQYSDLLILMEMMANLLSKDFMADLRDEHSLHTTGEGPDVSAADVVLYGLRITVPLMNAELLKFPSLCSIYLKLLTFLAEMHAEKVCQLPEQLLSALLQTVRLGLNSDLGSDISKLCLENVTYLAEHLSQSPQLQGGTVHAFLAHFLKMVFEMLILDETFDMDLFDTTCQALFALICCHQEAYKALVNDLLSQHPTYQARLVEAFTNLTPSGSELIVNRNNKRAFMENVERYLVDIRGFLCVR